MRLMLKWASTQEPQQIAPADPCEQIDLACSAFGSPDQVYMMQLTDNCSPNLLEYKQIRKADKE